MTAKVFGRPWPLVAGSARGGSLARASAVLAAGLVASTLWLGAGPVASAATPIPDQWTAANSDGGNSSDNPGEHVITASDAGRVRTAWTSALRSDTPTAPVVLNGVAYRVITTGNVSNPATFTATSARSGATLWRVSLPGNADYFHGMAAAGSRVLVSFDGWRQPGGVVAVDTVTRRIAWISHLPAASISWMGNSVAGQAYTDGARVYVNGAGNAINAYRFSDGAPLWKAALTTNNSGGVNGVDGIAVGAGVVYTGGSEGIVAYDATTGHRRWTAPAGGTPSVAGGRVFGLYGSQSVSAFPAAGCGTATCAPLWTTSFAKQAPDYLTVGGADAATLFVTFRTARPSGPGFIGHVARLSASTGQLQWTTTAGDYTTGLIRGGNTVWLLNEYADSAGTLAERVLAYPTTGAPTAPTSAIALPTDYDGFPQSIAIASGTLLEQTWSRGYLIGYRVPGT